MTTIIILNAILFLILLGAFTFLLFELLKLSKRIKILESKKLSAEESAKYHKNALINRAGIKEEGFDFYENTCVCCNEVIPEGRQYCPNCEKKESKR